MTGTVRASRSQPEQAGLFKVKELQDLRPTSFEKVHRYENIKFGFNIRIQNDNFGVVFYALKMNKKDFLEDNSDIKVFL